MITVKSKGNFSKANSFLERLLNVIHAGTLNEYGRMGVEALQEATPKLTGKTANSWSYEIVREKGSASIVWKNSNWNDGVNVAVLIQYGHGTGRGVYVQGIDYINPAMKQVMNDIAESVRKEVENA